MGVRTARHHQRFIPNWVRNRRFLIGGTDQKKMNSKIIPGSPPLSYVTVGGSGIVPTDNVYKYLVRITQGMKMGSQCNAARSDMVGCDYDAIPQAATGNWGWSAHLFVCRILFRPALRLNVTKASSVDHTCRCYLRRRVRIIQVLESHKSLYLRDSATFDSSGILRYPNALS